MAIRISNYRIQISAVANGLSSVFNSAFGQVRGFARRVQGALNFGVSNFFNLRTLAADLNAAFQSVTGFDQLGDIDNLAKQSDALGVAIEDLQTYRKAADLAGVEQSAFDKAIQTSLRRISEAADGLQSSADIFEQLNIDPQELSQLDLGGQLRAFQEAFAGIENSADRARLGLELFGRQGVALQNVFTSSAIADAEAFFDSVGGGLDRADAAGVEAANDAIANLGDTIDIAQSKILAGIAPALTVASRVAQEFVANFRIDPDAVTDAIVRGVAFVEGFIGSLGQARRAVDLISGAWDFVREAFGTAQQFILAGLQVISEQIQGVFQVLQTAAEFAGLDSLADTLGSTADAAGTFADSFANQSQEIQNSLDNIGSEPEILTGGFADRVRAELERLQDLDITPPINTVAAGEQFEEISAAAEKTGQEIKRSLDLRSLTQDAADTINLLNNRGTSPTINTTQNVNTQRDRENFRPLERKTDSTNRLLQDIRTEIQNQEQEEAVDLNVEVELICA